MSRVKGLLCIFGLLLIPRFAAGQVYNPGIPAPSANGIVVQTAPGISAGKAVAANSSKLVVSNGNGVSPGSILLDFGAVAGCADLTDSALIACISSDRTISGVWTYQAGKLKTTDIWTTIIRGSLGNQVIGTTDVAGAVNSIEVKPAIAGKGPSISAVGSDANIPLVLKSKGSSGVCINTDDDCTGTPGPLSASQIDLTAEAAPSTPSAGIGRVYVETTSKNAAVKDDAGVVKHMAQSKSAVSNQYLASLADDGTFTQNQPACATLSDSSIFCAATGATLAETSTYQILAADFTNLKTIYVASGTFTMTLVASTSQPTNGKYIDIVNYGSGVVTVARSGQNINGGTTSLTLEAASATAPRSMRVKSDGTNYVASKAITGLVAADIPTLNQNTTGNAATATALAANGANCTNQFPRGVDASGAVESCAGVSLTTDTAANQGTTTTVLHGNASGQPSFGPIVGADMTAATVTTTQTSTGVNRWRCDIPVGDTSASVLVDAQLGPQKRICIAEAAVTVSEILVDGDAGTPNVIVGRRTVAGTATNMLSAALATAASGGIACSKTTAVTSFNGTTTCSATLQNNTLAVGDYVELVSGTAGGTARLMNIHIIGTKDSGQ